jgi:hypothetical protein
MWGWRRRHRATTRKDVWAVIEATERPGLARNVARLRPMIVVKG